ncbi:MAG: radical SAM superfamily enzyme YgiQ (UPF0313 family) [Maricaulis maris]|jgi:glycosyltransferase involved in cell wall biosynthesis
MTHQIYAVSSEWGGDKGGINIFNRFLVEAMARVVDPDVKVHAVVTSQAILPTGVGSNIRFARCDATPGSLAALIEENLGKTGSSAETITLIGHDVHTGVQVVEARDILQENNSSIRAAVFCHMDYSKYQPFKGVVPTELRAKQDRQRTIIQAADHVMAVGPSLKASFERLRQDNGGDATIHEVIPGFPPDLEASANENPSDALKFFFSARINPENDRVKNGRSTLKAIYQAYSKHSHIRDSRFHPRGSFTVFGFTDPKIDRGWFCEGIDQDELGKHLYLNLHGFKAQEEIFAELRDSHIALMPSVQEGFGLVGWEAVCAGIPLVCSDQSGLAQFLENLFRDQPMLHRESVAMVRLSDSDADVSAIASAIETLTNNNNLKRAVSHARQLSKHLSAHFSWDAAARNVAHALSLATAGPSDWQDRQYQGRVALFQHEQESQEQAEVVQEALDYASNGRSLDEWPTTCTALNYLSDLGKMPTYASVDIARTQLAVIATGISAAYDADQRALIDIRCSGRFDVAWRFMAAASSIYASNIETSLSGFLESIPESMMLEIRSDGFLCRELLYYTTKFAGEFASSSRNVALEFFEDICRQASNDHSIQVRLARLEAAVPELSKVLNLDPAQCAAYSKERQQCAQVQTGVFDLNDLVANAGDLAPTALALTNVDAKMRDRGIEQLFTAWQEHSKDMPTPAWRGDKLLRAALLAASVHARELIEFVEALAKDEEESLRWAAIDLAFSPTLRKRLFRASSLGVLKMTSHQLKARLGAIVDTAVETGDFHPWMQREFLIRFGREHSAPVLNEVEDRFCASDFPIARTLIGAQPASEKPWRFKRLHPEIQKIARKLRERVHRILLVLPPISRAVEGRSVSKTSTPPLGLGMIGSELLAQGHDVYLADCHRAPEIQALVIRDSRHFDWVGFNVVLPTIRSVFSMAAAIKAHSSPPAIVVGGPAVNARSFRNAAVSADDGKCWDFEICSAAGANFSHLVNSMGAVERELPTGIIPNEHSELVIKSGQSLPTNTTGQAPAAWQEPVLLDRRIFSTPSGEYEPQRTRAIDGSTVEAHVVMSRGCDWNCSFCTERVDQSGGERRRSLASIKNEVSELAQCHPDLRIQFVDDNLLPQIATIRNKRVAQAEAVEWTEQFISLLTSTRDSAPVDFGWRGIFRVEDFLKYEEVLPGFIDQLAASGCRMLAFGIEHGNEQKRKKMKVGVSATNAEFTALFQRLRDAGIHSKGYFILGGPKETVDSSEETIAFAIQSGVSLAYFALYKEFVPALNTLRSEQSRGSNLHRRYSEYEQLEIMWDLLLTSALDAGESGPANDLIARISTEAVPIEPTEIISVYKELSQLGFRFTDIVKYSDQHASDSPAAEVLEKVNFANAARFEDTVASAYIRFYLRRTFIDTYRSLLADGY